MKLPLNPRTGSLAQRVREDFRLLSSDTKLLLRQALNDELPSAKRRILRSAGDGLDRGRNWLASGSRSLRRNERIPYFVGAIGVAAAAGLAWYAWQKFRESCCCAEDAELASEEE